MSLPTFLKLVEIQTKLASLFPFIVGLLFVIYRFDAFDPVNTIIFFSGMLIFDLTTTAINNYMDYKKATSEIYKKESNIIGQKEIPEWLVVTTILTMLSIATTLGIWLVFRTDLFVLFIGMVCFGIGIFYTFGPIPLSRMPLGEVFSGVTMGFGITFLIIYVNAFDQGIANLLLTGRTLSFEMDILLMLEIFWISLPCIFTIANIMLANNICDLEDDIKNKRFTLPYYIGRKNAVRLFDALYIFSFLAILSAVSFNVLPLVMLLVLIVGVPVFQHVHKFNQKQSKAETFSVSLKNMVLVNGSMVAALIIAIIVL
ncbi:1,4-dihydroxy-2-naphthoate polyprenyltransferase [Oceanobacillus halophilus]|uniref:1,4-dihydroxy-2-naphthoate polyprenyltransferase n=1 Tax=Oceanobacillus halophilus TaxID=930130 RepID=A0A495A393_9BACI|nr:1,4-dihydroxy-2-naphthoate polyprenyltransferase [Oceanobacillus halophilus]RKQ33928.1 1,4-dihydroxy-2-naphthoate polyprenyltransferase [Oceanobacillus halophilus]